MTRETFYIGMDLGGTTFKAVAVSSHGQIFGRTQGATDPACAPEVLVQRMVAAMQQLTRDVATGKRRLQGIGLGIPGILDLPAGIVRQAPHLPRWSDFDLRASLSRDLDGPFAIDNDANAAARGEAWLGAARGIQHFVMLTLGTGVGSGIMVAGQMLHGAHGYAGEMGHTVVEPNGPPCDCGSQGCLEQFVSGTAVARTARPLFGAIDGPQLARLARQGDARARHIFRDVGYYLGLACASFANIFNPQRIILGGAVAGAFDLFIDTMHATMQARTMARTYQSLHIVQAQCGTDAGGLGAAFHAMQCSQP